MGGFGGLGAAFGGAVDEFGQLLHEKHLQDYGAAIQTKKDLSDAYKTLREDPHMQDLWPDLAQKQIQAISTDPRKFIGGKIPKELDLSQYLQLQGQRASGLAPSPANQGQQPTNVPPPPIGQSQSGPAGQGMQLPSMQQATAPSGNTDDPGAPGFPSQSPVPPPPGVSNGQATLPGTAQGGGPGLINRTGAPIGGTPSTTDPQSMPGAISAPPPAAAAFNGAQAAQSLQALPPSPSAGGAPAGVTVVGPQQAAATAGPSAIPSAVPPPPGHVLGAEELFQRQLSHQTALDQAQQTAEMNRLTGVAAFNTKQDQLKLQQHVDTLKATINPATGRSVWDELMPREQAAIASGVQTLGTTPRMLSAPGMVPGSSAQPGQLDMSGNPVDPKGTYHLRPRPDGEFDWIPQQIAQKLEWAADPADPQKMRLYQVNPYNPADKQPVTDIRKINPAMIPQVTNSEQWKQVTQPDGSIALVPVNVQGLKTRTLTPPPPTAATQSSPTTRSNGQGGGASTISPPPPLASGDQSQSTLPKGSIVAGGHPLTPEQVITNGQRLGALDNTIEILQRVQKGMPMLNSLIDAGKIQMQIDPNQGIFKAFVNRAVPMSPEEAQMAGDMASLMEHINTLRGPLGATGFRGEDAFNALQAQRGQLMANPAVTSQVLANTLKALNRTRAPIAQGLKRAGQDTTGNTPPPPAATVPAEVKALLGASSVKPGIHKLSDGTSWMKSADGGITKQ